MKKVIILIFLVIGLFAGDLEEGILAYQANDYDKAVKHWKVLAEKGDAESQYYLGYMYRTGKGVPQSDTESLKWTRKSAKQGNNIAIDTLGMMYKKGDGVQQDYSKAMT